MIMAARMDAEGGTTGRQFVRPRSVDLSDTERWASLGAGTALTAAGLWQRSRGGLLAAAIGGYLMYRGNSGQCPISRFFGAASQDDKFRAIRIQQSISVERDPDDVYALWRDFERLPEFMRHLAEVTVTGSKRSRWVAKTPLGISLAWEAVIEDERPGELMVWRSTPGSWMEAGGRVRLKRSAHVGATDVHVIMDYRPPAGLIGETLAKTLNPFTEAQMRADLLRLKQLLETGETATIEGQPTGAHPVSNGSGVKRVMHSPSTPTEQVDEGSELSFPASDPPSAQQPASQRLVEGMGEESGEQPA